MLDSNTIIKAEKTQIWKHFSIVFLPTLIIILAISLWVGHSLINAEIGTLDSQQNFLSKFAQRRINYSINVTKGHLTGLYQEDEFQQPLTKTTTTQIENAFRTIIFRNPRYDQIRWIDAQGHEVVRVNNVDGKPVVVARNQLQDKSNSSYFNETIKLPEGDIFVGSINLNKEHGKVEIPYKPTVRIAIKLFDGPNKAGGIIVINLYADHLFNAMNDAIGGAAAVYLLNSDGYWLSGFKPEDNWGFDLGKDNSLAKTNPKLWQSILKSKKESIQNNAGLWNWSWNQTEESTNKNPRWVTLTFIPKSQLTEIHHRVWTSISYIVVPLLLFIGFGLLRYFVTENNNKKSLLEVQRLESEAELAQKMHNANIVFERVVQASPVGKIIVGIDGCITMVNPKAELMFGYTQQELVGHQVHMLIPEELRESHKSHVSGFLKNTLTRPMGAGNTLWGLSKNGTKIPLEIGLTKLDVNQNSAVMVTLTDLTLRYSLIKDNARFESLIKNSSNFVAVVESRGNFTYINQAGIEMLGLDEVDVQKLTINELISQESQHILKDNFWSVIADHLDSNLELSFIHHKSRLPIWISLNIFSISDVETGDISIGIVGQNQSEKRAMIEQLSESQAQWQNLAEAMPQFVWTCSADGRCDYLNKKWGDYTGIDVQSQLGSAWLKQVHPDDQMMLSESWNQSVENKVDFDVEYRIRRYDGQYRWFKARGVPVYGVDGNIIKWYGSNTDIEELKQIQAALSFERNALATWFDTSPIALWEVDSTKAIAYIASTIKSGVADLSHYFSENHEARATLLSGIKIIDCNAESIRMRNAQNKNELIGTLLNISHSLESQIDYTEMILDSFHGKAIRNRQMRAVTTDGIELQLFLSLTVTNKALESRRAILAELDVTEKLALESELDLHRQHLEKLVQHRTNQLEGLNHFLTTITDSLPVLIGYWDKNKKCQFANKKYLPIFGIDNAVVVGRDMEEVMGHDLYTSNIKYIEGALSGEAQRFERSISQVDGSLFHTITNYIPDMQNEMVKGFFVLSSDVTDLKNAQIEMDRLNQALSERTQQAENASKAKSDFVANMSHEIRTPMNAVMGMTQLLLDTTLNEQQFNYLSKIRSASSGLMSILNDILDYSKMEAGRLEIELAELNLDDLLDNISDLFSISASTKNIEMIFEISPNCPKYIISDQLRLTQILNNLVGNAIKFTSNGIIRIAVSYQEKPTPQIYFEVIDSGIGMSKEQTSHIFTPFMQADTSTTRKYGGTGLGLSISQNLITIMGGEIGVASKPNQGSKFWFKLPIQLGNSKSYQESYESVNKQILIVDDSKESRLVLSTYLEQWKMSTVMAESAELALQLILQSQVDNKPFDLLLVDWKMPGKSGLWLAEEVQKAHKANVLKHLPFIAMVTAYNRHELMEEASQLQLSLEAVLTKPVTPSRLYNLVSDNSIADIKKYDVYQPGSLSNTKENIEKIQGAKILLVEDNPVNQEVAHALLHKIGLKVEIANNGQEAVYLVSQNNYDLILMDLQMPVMDGFDATKAIRATLKGKVVPILALTAAAFGEDKQKALAVGMNDHLAKPINTSELTSKLCLWIPEKVHQEMRGKHVANLQARDSYPLIKGIDIANTLNRLGLDWSIVRKFIKSFSTQFDDWCQQIDTALAQDDMPTTVRLAHTLRGAAANIGADELSASATKLEANLKVGDSSNLDDVKQGLQQLLIEINTQLTDLTTDSPATTLEQSEIDALLKKLENLLSHHKLIPKSLLKDVDSLCSHPQLGEFARKLLSDIDKFNFNEAVSTIHKMMKEV
jgi:two-component system, sensor histidine kinase and response regulator